MIEIIFRGKRTDNGEWAEGYFIKWYDGTASIETGKYGVKIPYVMPLLRTGKKKKLRNIASLSKSRNGE